MTEQPNEQAAPGEIEPAMEGRGITPSYSLRYPDGTTPPAGPKAFKELAEDVVRALDTKGSATAVTNAQSAATSAGSAASAAQTTADSAKTAADNAQASANTAYNRIRGGSTSVPKATWVPIGQGDCGVLVCTISSGVATAFYGATQKFEGGQYWLRHSYDGTLWVHWIAMKV